MEAVCVGCFQGQSADQYPQVCSRCVAPSAALKASFNSVEAIKVKISKYCKTKSRCLRKFSSKYRCFYFNLQVEKAIRCCQQSNSESCNDDSRCFMPDAACANCVRRHPAPHLSSSLRMKQNCSWYHSQPSSFLSA